VDSTSAQEPLGRDAAWAGTIREEVIDLLGRHKVDVDDHSTLAEKATAQALQRISWARPLAVSGSLPSAALRVTPYWHDTQLRAAT
jgi:hypothetical protein